MSQGHLHSNQAHRNRPPSHQKEGEVMEARKAKGHLIWQATATRRSYHQKAVLQHNHRAKHSQGRMKWEMPLHQAGHHA